MQRQHSTRRPTRPEAALPELLVSLAHSSRHALWSASASGIVAGLCSAALIAIVGEALRASNQQRWAAGLAFAGVAALMLLARWFSQRSFVRIGQRTLARLRLALAAHWANTPLVDLERAGPGRVLSSMVEDVDVISTFFSWLPNLIVQTVIVAGCLIYLAWLSWSAFLLMLVSILLGAFGRRWMARRANMHAASARDEEDRLYAHFNALFDGGKELALHANRRRAFLDQVLATTIQNVRAQRGTSDRWSSGALQGAMLLFYAALVCVAYPVVPLLDAPPSVRAAYVLVLLYMVSPAHAVLEALPLIGRTRIAAARLSRVSTERARTLPEARDRRQPRALGTFHSVELAGVRYRNDEHFELGPLHLELRPGEIVFIIGGNGSGKTTLAKLLVGLYEPQSGERRINDEPLDVHSTEYYSAHFSVVFSDFHLFERVYDFDPGRLDRHAREWLRELDLDHRISIDERGRLSTTALSSGQRKRLALLVAALDDRPVCCFDEWAADQDPPYKQIFYQRLLPRLAAQGRALLVITHDHRYFHLATRCLKLERGALCPTSVAPRDATALTAERRSIGALAPTAGPWRGEGSDVVRSPSASSPAALVRGER